MVICVLRIPAESKSFSLGFGKINFGEKRFEWMNFCCIIESRFKKILKIAMVNKFCIELFCSVWKLMSLLFQMGDEIRGERLS